MRRKTRGQEFDQLLQNLKAAAFFAKYFAHAWSGQLVFIIIQLQSWRAIFAENTNVQLSKQVELGGLGFTSLFSYLQDSLSQ